MQSNSDLTIDELLSDVENSVTENASATDFTYVPGTSLTSTLWNQSGTIYVSVDGKQTALSGYTYNQFCPTLTSNSSTHCVTGCSNTADSQILYYWLERGYDLNLSVTSDDYYILNNDSKKYYVSNNPVNNEASLSTLNSLLARSSEDGILVNGDFIAALNFYCGVKNHSKYGSSTSTTWYINVYSNGTNSAAFKAAGFDSYYFIPSDTSYTASKRMFSGTSITDVGYSVLRENFDYGEVVRIGIPGHAIYMDGYRYNSSTGEYEYHLNYGWGIYSSSSKWYTTDQLDDLEITYMNIDISPKITVDVTNSRSDYYGGSFLRGVERINHIQNETSTTFTFADDIAGEQLSQTATFDITSKVDLSFENFNVNYYSTADIGFNSNHELDFDLIDGSIIVNASQADGAIFCYDQLTVTLDGSWIYSGYDISGYSSIVNSFESDNGYDYSKLSQAIASVSGYSVNASAGNDVITLTNSSALFGDVSLGTGNNIINIETGSLIYGDFVGGKDTLQVNMSIGELNAGPMIVLDAGDTAETFYSMTDGSISVDITEDASSGIYELIDFHSTANIHDYEVVVNTGNNNFTLSYYERTNGDYQLIYDGTVLGLKLDNIVAPVKSVMLYKNGNLVSATATMSDKAVGSGYVMNVTSGGVATGNTVSDSGLIDVMYSGFAEKTTVGYNGLMYVQAGAAAQGTTVNINGKMYVVSAGTATATTINKDGLLTLSSGASAAQTTLTYGGSMYIDGGVASDTIVNSGAVVNVASSGILSGAVNSSGTVVVFDGGSAVKNTLVHGSMLLSNGGVASDTTVNGGGSMSVANSGYAQRTAVKNGGKMEVGKSGSASGTTVSSGGSMLLTGDAEYSGNIVSGIKGGVAASTYVMDGATLNVTGNAVASGTVIYSGGTVCLYESEVYNPIWNTDPGYAIINGLPEYVTASACLKDVELQYGGKLELAENSVLSGNIVLGGTVSVNGGVDATGANIDFSLTDRTTDDEAIISDISSIRCSSYSITVSANQENGVYTLAEDATKFKGSITISSSTNYLGSLTVNGSALNYGSASYRLVVEGGNLKLSVSGSIETTDVNTNILDNGVSQILAWDSEQGKVGYLATTGSKAPKWKGIWEWSGADADLWRVAGAGHFKGTEVDYDGILLYNGVGDRFAAWTDLGKGSYGYVNLCKVDGSFNTECLADLDGNEYDDILIYDNNGSIGVVLDGTTYKDIWHVNKGQTAKWELAGAGSFDDGADKLVMVNNENNFVYLWTNNDSTFSSWNWSTKSVAKLADGWEVAAVGDFEGDGIDDIMVIDTNTNNVWVWDDGNANNKRWRGTLGDGFEIEAVGDYNGDGKEDLLLREYNTGWGGMGYWGAGYAGNWVDLKARIETDMKSSFEIIA